MKKQQKVKKVAYRFIDPKSDVGRPMYALLTDLVDAYHDDLARTDAKIALAWNLAWKPDVDGRLVLGKCKKVADLEKEIADLDAYDFVIILLEAFWTDPLVTDRQRRALLDHELTHAAVKLDERGEPQIDERGRTVYRMRRHDLEEFACIVERHGCYTSDIEQFYGAILKSRARPDVWVGFSTLQQELRQAGAAIPMDAILDWSEAERREARTWALLRLESDLPVMPAHVASAVTTPPETHA